jgi:putative ABC transport system permease protein
VFAGVVLTTVDGTTTAVARDAVGGDVRASGVIFPQGQRTRIAQLDGVAHSAPIAHAGSLNLDGRGDQTDVTVLTGDTGQLAAIRSDVPSTLSRKVDGRVPILVSRDLAAKHPVGSTAELGPTGVRIVGVLPTYANIGADTEWVLVDEAFTADVYQPEFTPDLILLTTDPGADPAAVGHDIQRIQPAATVVDIATETSAIRANPATAGMRTALIATAVAGIVLAALAVFVGSLSASASRSRSVAVLRTMGLSPRQTTGVVVWETLPIVLISLVVGAILGAGLPWLVVATTDLSPYTGGSSAPLPLYDPATIAVVLVVFLAVSALAAAVAVWVARRASPAATVKMGSE